MNELQTRLTAAVASADAGPDNAVLSCAGCERLRGQLVQMSQLRNEALFELARAREQMNEVYIRFAAGGFPEQPRAVEEVPLRYRVVDLANAELKRRLPSLHWIARQLAGTGAAWLGGRRRNA
jgi:hypothetical protein